jgi:hypothetical protein
MRDAQVWHGVVRSGPRELRYEGFRARLDVLGRQVVV